MYDYIQVDPQILHGKPHVKGTGLSDDIDLSWGCHSDRNAQNVVGAGRGG